MRIIKKTGPKKTAPKKPNLSGAILLMIGLLGLYCSATQAAPQAAPKVKNQAKVVLIINKVVSEVKSPTNKLVNNYAYPSITSEVFNQYSQITIQSTSQISQQPSLGIKVTDFANLAPHKFAKKNSLFEFAAKFNDKLQQVLAYFDFSSTSTDSKNKNISEKDSKKKSSLIAKNSKKALQANARVSKVQSNLY
ncbi:MULTISPECIES: hypothetical protein [unclassified Colwellia]|uniref:hypothetical protein n=1 Tax=unclassified Colwellia TaxID=196834 RepID=UPI0015F5CFB8|nr:MULTISPECIES: hypothetical protein [unclassified Colwellia]MBA6223328.1 hypothetical protein [Colwellia sp. MB3u-45]MBA6267856.1 hypothetical protein [Colwellia sp. MB3u-43]MBA6287956.1 hypothetical protein [Colwellia sp. MB3u-4]MBA6322290.1 hypothetical protein [Colwellia sp. MB02u-19]MBA6323897.1 hypothetical protein [Colwellia sp. MB02u-18]